MVVYWKPPNLAILMANWTKLNASEQKYCIKFKKNLHYANVYLKNCELFE